MWGIILIAVSYFFVIAALVDIIKGDSDTEPDVLWGLLIFFFLLSASGVYLLIKNILVIGGYVLVVGAIIGVYANKNLKTLREKQILKFIGKKNGKITTLELVSEFNLTPEKAKEKLDGLCQTIGGELNVTENGGLVYTFPGFLTKEEKDTAQDPLSEEAE
jgi:hypothetical protein